MADAGEEMNQGGLIYTKHGKGNFIYTVLVEDMHLAELITFIKLRVFRIYENKL